MTQLLIGGLFANREKIGSEVIIIGKLLSPLLQGIVRSVGGKGSYITDPSNSASK